MVSVFILMLLGGCMNKSSQEEYINLRNPQFSPDGKLILYDIAESNKSTNKSTTQIRIFNQETNESIWYSNQDYNCFMPSFSYDGKKIVFIVVNFKAHLDRNVFLEYQIATMNIDGTDFKILTTMKSLKAYPVFSHKGDKILFAMTTDIRTEGATPAFKYDLYELDLKTNNITLFAGQKFEFFGIDRAYYFNDDAKVLINGYSPWSNLPDGLGRDSFNKKNNDSELYIVKRGQNTISYALAKDLQSSKLGSLDANESIYFEADGGSKVGSGIYRLSKDNVTTRYEWAKTLGTTYSSAVSPNGEQVVVSGTARGENATSGLKLFALNTKTFVWSEINPPNKPTKEIVVK
jgi:Tol biopolymer transport system component